MFRDFSGFIAAMIIGAAAVVACGGGDPGAGGAAANGGNGAGATSGAGGVGGLFGEGGSGGVGGASDSGVLCLNSCDDGFSCTIDSCNGGKCSHTIGPNAGATACPAGQYCTVAKGCTAAPACATAADCTAAWTGDACKTNIKCDPASSVCLFTLLDKDLDGHPPQICGGDDCNDNDVSIHPGATEVCDGKDNDCDGEVDNGATCADSFKSCQLGACRCKAENTCASSSICVDKMTDGKNCGTCGTVCPATATCTGGTCACPAPLKLCSLATGCTDTTSDKNNCGACGTVCTTPANEAPVVCVSSACVYGACLTGFANCDGSQTNGCESNPQTDQKNCGTCGHDCLGGSCLMGQCQPVGDVACTKNADCPLSRPWCDPSSLKCTGCLGDWHCAGCGTSSGSFCVSGTCTSMPIATGYAPTLCGAFSGTDCAIGSTMTVGGKTVCGNCLKHSDCPAGKACFEGGCYSLKTCTVATDCGSAPWTCTASNVCSQCRSDADCTGGQRCDTAIERCRECLTNADCPASAKSCVGGICTNLVNWGGPADGGLEGGADACAAETDVAFCARLGKDCGSATAPDNCGAVRVVASCGSCISPRTCGGGGDANVCGCETNAVFCVRLGKNCGTVVGVDACGDSHAVASCGMCSGACMDADAGIDAGVGSTCGACGGGGTANVCGGINLALWKAECAAAGIGSVTGGGVWFTATDSFKDTSTQTVPCTNTRCGPLPAIAPFACASGGRDGGHSAHLVGIKADGWIYMGVSFGGRPAGSTGVKFWYRSTGTANNGKVMLQLGMVQNIPSVDWPASGGACDWGTTNPDQCWNLPTLELPAAATWTEITVRWADLAWMTLAGQSEPGWWSTGKTSIGDNGVFISLGLYDASPPVTAGTLDLWMDDVTFVTN